MSQRKDVLILFKTSNGERLENKVQLASRLPWPNITQGVNGDGMTCPLNAYI